MGLTPLCDPLPSGSPEGRFLVFLSDKQNKQLSQLYRDEEPSYTPTPPIHLFCMFIPPQLEHFSYGDSSSVGQPWPAHTEETEWSSMDGHRRDVTRGG